VGGVGVAIEDADRPAGVRRGAGDRGTEAVAGAGDDNGAVGGHGATVTVTG
jgi:hypothetical protein